MRRAAEAGLNSLVAGKGGRRCLQDSLADVGTQLVSRAAASTATSEGRYCDTYQPTADGGHRFVRTTGADGSLWPDTIVQATKGVLVSAPEASTRAWLEQGLQEIRSDRSGQLSFRTRRRLLLSFGLPQPGSLSKGHCVRGALAVLVVRKVLPVWEARYHERHPHELIESARLVLEGSADRDVVGRAAYQYGGALIDRVPPEDRPAQYVGHAAACAAFVAVDDEALLPDEGVSDAELDSPEDPDLWDCAVWAAAAYAGDFPWTDDVSSFDASLNREFWSWYLTDAIAEAQRHFER